MGAPIACRVFGVKSWDLTNWYILERVLASLVYFFRYCFVTRLSDGPAGHAAGDFREFELKTTRVCSQVPAIYDLSPTCAPRVDKHIATMKKLFTLLAFREARKKLEFVLPVESRDHDNFRAAKVLPRRRRGYGRKLGAVIL